MSQIAQTQEPPADSLPSPEQFATSQLSRLDHIYLEAAEAWQKSIRYGERIGSPGDTQFLNAMLVATEQSTQVMALFNE